jgi:hypothetical protein
MYLLYSFVTILPFAHEAHDQSQSFVFEAPELESPADEIADAQPAASP